MCETKELSCYKMNTGELRVWKDFSDAIMCDCNNMNIAQEYFHYVTDNLESKYYQHSCGFSETYGYFMVDFGDKGELSISILTKNIHHAKLDFLKRILWNVSVQYECKNRQALEEEWNFSTGYDGRKNIFEDSILKLHLIYSYEEIRDYIADRTKYMNRWFNDQHWAYSEDQNQFIEISQSLEHE